MKKQQYIVFGLNRFGTSVARTLAAAGNEVVAVDQDADRVAQIADDVSYAAGPPWPGPMMKTVFWPWSAMKRLMWPMRMP